MADEARLGRTNYSSFNLFLRTEYRRIFCMQSRKTIFFIVFLLIACMIFRSFFNSDMLDEAHSSERLLRSERKVPVCVLLLRGTRMYQGPQWIMVPVYINFLPQKTKIQLSSFTFSPTTFRRFTSDFLFKGQPCFIFWFVKLKRKTKLQGHFLCLVRFRGLQLNISIFLLENVKFLHRKNKKSEGER